MASAIWRIRSSLTLQPNLFQLFHPMGGVAASELSCAERKDGATSRPNSTMRILVLSFMTLRPRGFFMAYFALGKREFGRLVDCLITSLGTINTLRGRSDRLDAMRSSRRLAARFPISDVPWSTVVRGIARKSE